MLGLGGGREVIGLQVAPAGTEDPEEKLEVCHLTGRDPSVLTMGRQRRVNYRDQL